VRALLFHATGVRKEPWGHLEVELLAGVPWEVSLGETSVGWEEPLVVPSEEVRVAL